MATVTPSDIGTDFSQREITVNLPHPLPENTLAELTELQENVRTAFSWASRLAADMVLKKLLSGDLPEDDDHTQAAYRAKVMNYVFDERASWLSTTESTNIAEPANVKRSEFNADILLQLVAQLRPAPPESAQLTELVKRYANGITKGSPTLEKSVLHFWLAIAYFRYDSVTDGIDVDIAIYSIELKTTYYKSDNTGQTTQAMIHDREISQSAVAPRSIDMVKVESSCSARRYDFNNTAFLRVKPTVENTLHNLEIEHVKG